MSFALAECVWVFHMALAKGLGLGLSRSGAFRVYQEPSSIGKYYFKNGSK